MMNLLNLLVFAYLAVSGVILTYIVIKTDKTRKITTKKQSGKPTFMVVPLSIVLLLTVYFVRFGLMTMTGALSEVGAPFLVGGLIAVVPLLIVGFFFMKTKHKGGNL